MIHCDILQPNIDATNNFKRHFYVGDTVRVRKDIVSGDRYTMYNVPMSGYAEYVNDAMADLAGQTMTIKEEDANGYYTYENRWHWTDLMFDWPAVDDEWLEPINFEEISALL